MKDWRKQLTKKFVEPLNTKMRAMNLNGEPCVLATAKEMEQFINQTLSEQERLQEEALDIIFKKNQFDLEEKDKELKDIVKEMIGEEVGYVEHMSSKREFYEGNGYNKKRLELIEIAKKNGIDI